MLMIFFSMIVGEGARLSVFIVGLHDGVLMLAMISGGDKFGADSGGIQRRREF